MTGSVEMRMNRFVFFTPLMLLFTGVDTANADPDADWQARATAVGVVYANRFDDENADFFMNLWPDPNVDRRSAYYDEGIRASGNGSARFDFIPGGEGFGGELAVSLGDDPANQFGAGDEFWVQWRQRFDPYVIDHLYQTTQGSGQWKQLIIGQGQLPGQERFETRSCTENEIVVANLSGKRYAQSYHGCWVYLNITSSRESGAISRMNLGDQSGPWTCQYWPPGSDESGCLYYRPNQWMTFMVHVVLGPAGEAVSSLQSSSQLVKGFVDSTYELYVSYEGGPLQLVHLKTGIVFRRGNYDDDPGSSSHQAKYGFFRWTPFLSFKDGAEQHQIASTWIDEIIISRNRIPAPATGPRPKPPILDSN